VAYRGNRYSVPHVHAGRAVVVREPHLPPAGVDRRTSPIDFSRGDGHRADSLCKPAAEVALPAFNTPAAIVELTPGPGVGLHYVAPEVEFRPLSSYNAFCEEVAHVAAD
jgi:hypothetical protein